VGRLVRTLLFVLAFILGVVLVRLVSPPRVVITWQTASEVDTAGFHIYRSHLPAGPFELITATPIPARGDPLTGAPYRYVDRDVIWGERYQYQLVEVLVDGTEEPQSEIVEGQAGVGWSWAMAVGALLGLLTSSLQWFLTTPPATSD
jgi:hypothetical protein